MTNRNIIDYDTIIFSYRVVIPSRWNPCPNYFRFLDIRVNLYSSVAYSGGCNNNYEREWVRCVKDRRTTLGEWIEVKKTNYQWFPCPMCFMNNRDAEQCQGHFFPLRPEVEHNKQTLSRSWENTDHIVFFLLFCGSVPYSTTLLYSPAVIFWTRSKPVLGLYYYYF